jgi:adenylate cyclase
MASLIPGYEYDIFISYRQKDNKHDGWVTKFVENLNGELESTFKEDISIYFDENPYDHLQETHDVGMSLEGKLKCLIFIPILSQTYCDPNSYAWQYELLAFKKFSNQDRFGKNIRLKNGNYATRILPVRIHDLDQEDINLFERETGSVLRAMDFIFKTSAGVNRPLQSNEDRPNDNLNKTFYRDQTNKVANAIKEIITALKNPALRSGETTALGKPINVPAQGERPIKKRTPITWPLIVAIALLVLISGYILYQRLFYSAAGTREIDKSIAVLPFVDISESHNQAYFTDGMMVEILDHLFKMKDLRIIPLNSTLKYKDSTVPLKEIAHELGVAHLIQGSVRRAGDKVKISVALIEGSTEKYLWQHTYEDDIAEVSRVFVVQSDVATQIAHALSVQITPEVNSRMNTFPTKSKEAYDLYLKGRDAWGEQAIANLNKAIAIDSTFADAFVELGRIYWGLAAHNNEADLWRKSKDYLYKAIALDPQNSRAYSELGVVAGGWDWDNKAGLRYFQKAISLNPSETKNYNDLFFFYLRKFDCDSMRFALQKMKQLQPGDYYFYEVTIKICAGDEEGLRMMKPPADFMKTEYDHINMELSRLLILKKYNEVLEILNTTDQLDEITVLSLKATTLGLMGKAPEARSEIAKLEKMATTRYVWPAMLALAYMAIGDESHAYAYLEKGIKEHDMAVHFIQYDPPFYTKRNDMRYQALMKGRWVN